MRVSIYIYRVHNMQDDVYRCVGACVVCVYVVCVDVYVVCVCGVYM